MTPRVRLATASRDPYQALRRVERQQQLVEELCARQESPMTFAELGRRLRVSSRTVARDVERLATSGVPLEVRRGRGGGVRLVATATPPPVSLDLPEIAALVSSLAVLGPTATLSSASAMRKLTDAMSGEPTAP